MLVFGQRGVITYTMLKGYISHENLYLSNVLLTCLLHRSSTPTHHSKQTHFSHISPKTNHSVLPDNNPSSLIRKPTTMPPIPHPTPGSNSTTPANNPTPPRDTPRHPLYHFQHQNAHSRSPCHYHHRKWSSGYYPAFPETPKDQKGRGGRFARGWCFCFGEERSAEDEDAECDRWSGEWGWERW